MIREIHETLRTILMLAGVASREVIYEPLTVRTAEIRRARAGRRFPPPAARTVVPSIGHRQEAPGHEH
jgi:hypothetical protein